MTREVKNQHDQRVCKTERRFQLAVAEVLSQDNQPLTVLNICRAAGIKYNTTFYDHYHDINDALAKIKKNLIDEFRTELSSHNRKMPPKNLYTYLLAFVYRHQKYFSAMLKRREPDVIIELLRIIYPMVNFRAPHYSPELGERDFRLFSAEAIALISCWMDYTDFDYDRILIYANELARLGRTFQERDRNLNLSASLEATNS